MQPRRPPAARLTALPLWAIMPAMNECATWEPVQAAIVAVLSHRIVWWALIITALVTLWLVIDAAFKITEWALNGRAKKTP